MDRIEGLSIGLDLDSLALERGLTGVKDRLRTVNSEMKRNMSAFDRGDRSIEKYETRVQGLNKKLEVQKKVTEENYKEYQKMVREHGEGSKEAEKAERAYNNQAAALNNLERYVEGATKELEEMRKEQAFLESGWGKLSTGLDKFSGKMNSMGDTLTGVGRTLSMRVTAPIVAAGGAAFAAADQVDKAYRDIRVGTGATGDALDDLEKSFDNVFTSVPDGADQVANSLANLNTFTGATNDTLENLTTSVLDVSRLLKEDATANSQAFGESLKQWQRPAEEGTAILDYLYKLTQDYGIGLGELNGQLTNYGSVLNNAGFSMEEAAHFMASMESNGIAVSRVMPGLNKAFRNWAGEGKNSREELEKIVETIAETEDKQKALSLATDTFGAEGAQRLMTAIRNRAIPAFEDLAGGVEDARGSIQETAEETKTIGEEFAELKNTTIRSLRPVGEILLNLSKDYLPPVIEGVTNLAEWFEELDDTTKKTILSVAGVTAALGPASLLLGSTFKIVGSLAGGLSTITGIIGRAGGAGLLGRLGLMGTMTGPVGLTIGTVGMLGAGIYALTRESENLHDVNWDIVESLREEVNSADDLIAEYEKLESQNRLTKEEMLRYMDVLTELEQAKSEEAITKLREEQASLEEQSGMTKEELGRFIEINDEIIKQSPNTVQAISEQGNALIENLDAYKALNEEKRTELLLTAERELEKALENETQHLEDQRDLTKEIAELGQEIERTRQARVDNTKELSDAEEKLKSIQEEISQLEQDGTAEANLKLVSLQAQQREQATIVMDLEAEKEALKGTHDELLENLQTAGDKLETTREEIREIENLKADYEELILAQAGITSERGKGLDKIQEELELNKQKKRDIDEINSRTEGGIGNYEEQNEELRLQRQKLLDAKKELENINELAEKTIYNKKVNLSTNPSLDKLNRDIAESVHKRVTVGVDMGPQRLAYADGTPSGGHPIDGPAIVGDGGGRELIALPNGRMFLSPNTDTLLNLPKGTHVVPHQETRKLLNTPKYASGTSGWRGLVDNLRDSEFMKLLALVAKSVGSEPNQNTAVHQQSSNDNRDIIVLLQELINAVREGKNIVMNEQEVGRIVEPIVTETQERNKRVRDIFA
ncbi:phage tail tape measure protein [Ornithinibacillus salinisoli]|uniref:Phage tail tape measure protein n=1 Tax=Ornithinibacillus salinisoli TaxID=1848459 RepID=A0ABW4W2S7_9BACI